MKVRVRLEPGSIREGTGLSLILAGAAFFAVALAGYAKGTAWQEAHPGPPPVPATGTESVPVRLEGDPFARLTIPKIEVDFTVIEGTREEDLLKAPGHLAGSASPGEFDNCVIAGHRDRHFRHLGELEPGDPIWLKATGVTAKYEVESGRVVKPDQTDVLSQTESGYLTLITCYPFYYVGPAPERYVVRARLQRVDRETP